ncbi:CMP-N-acetylneuraminate-poly-alpha-2,8-sialyltransferase-like [Diadema antillarum]|uniref:CMP-N-acetylneuraminate-poly-alpha-2, 8-sialyltransferase-like n=1 Tax=Diadema antillarum TaxID=105358 RepID=UPI003A8AABBD
MPGGAKHNALFIGYLFSLSFIVCLCVLISSTGTPPVVKKPIRSQKDGELEQHLREFGGDELLVIPNCTCLLPDDNGTDTENKTVTKVSKVSSTKLKGKNIPENALTSALWNFKDTGDQQLYLYEKLLMKNWTINVTNIDALRTEMTSFHQKLSGEYLMMTQTNVKRQEKMKYVYRDKMRVTVSNDFFNRLPKVSYIWCKSWDRWDSWCRDNTVISTPRQTPKTNPFTLTNRFKSCAVVGNSGILRGSRCGSTIDSNDFIFRCNLGTLGPFKDDAGSKSNMTTMNPKLTLCIMFYFVIRAGLMNNKNLSQSFSRHVSLTNSKKQTSLNNVFADYKGYIWIPCLNFPQYFSVSLRAMKANKGSAPMVVCGYPAHFEQSLKFWAERSFTSRLSTGFYMAMSAIHVCDELNLFGFWPFSARFSNEEMEVPYHYYDDNSTLADANRVHSMNDEFSFLLQLHNLGVLRLHGGSCR